jgi:hypothetical protein
LDQIAKQRYCKKIKPGHNLLVYGGYFKESLIGRESLVGHAAFTIKQVSTTIIFVIHLYLPMNIRELGISKRALQLGQRSEVKFCDCRLDVPQLESGL